MAQTFLLLYAFTNKKTVKLVQIDRLLSAITTSPAEIVSAQTFVSAVLYIKKASEETKV